MKLQNTKLAKSLTSLFTASLITAAGFSTAFAAPITIYDGLEGGSGDVDNVLFQLPQTGTTINAIINSNPGFTATFSSSISVTGTGSSGQASIKPTNAETNLTDLCFTLDNNSTFTKLQLNPDAIANGSITFTVFYTLAPNIFNSSTFTLNANGQNFFTILATEGAMMTQVCWTSTVGVSDAAQYRVGGLAQGTPRVPDGGTTIALLGFSLLGLGSARKMFGAKA